MVLVYPSEEAVPMTTMTSTRADEIRKMVFIDSTWAQAKQIFKDPRLKGKSILTHVVMNTKERSKHQVGRAMVGEYESTDVSKYYLK